MWFNYDHWSSDAQARAQLRHAKKSSLMLSPFSPPTGHETTELAGTGKTRNEERKRKMGNQ